MIKLLRRGITAYRTAFQPTAPGLHAPGNPISVPLELSRHASVHTRVHIGQRMMCLAGWVWITQDGDCKDMVLGPGQVQQFDRHGAVLIFALERGQVAMDV